MCVCGCVYGGEEGFLCVGGLCGGEEGFLCVCGGCMGVCMEVRRGFCVLAVRRVVLGDTVAWLCSVSATRTVDTAPGKGIQGGEGIWLRQEGWLRGQGWGDPVWAQTGCLVVQGSGAQPPTSATHAHTLLPALGFPLFFAAVAACRRPAER